MSACRSCNRIVIHKCISHRWFPRLCCGSRKMHLTRTSMTEQPHIANSYVCRMESLPCCGGELHLPLAWPCKKNDVFRASSLSCAFSEWLNADVCVQTLSKGKVRMPEDVCPQCRIHVRIISVHWVMSACARTCKLALACMPILHGVVSHLQCRVPT